LWRNKQSLDGEGEGNAVFRVGEVHQLARFEGTLMAGYEGGLLAAYSFRRLSQTAYKAYALCEAKSAARPSQPP
jgi:hypothetical protein